MVFGKSEITWHYSKASSILSVESWSDLGYEFVEPLSFFHYFDLNCGSTRVFDRMIFFGCSSKVVSFKKSHGKQLRPFEILAPSGGILWVPQMETLWCINTAKNLIPSAHTTLFYTSRNSNEALPIIIENSPTMLSISTYM